MPWVETVQGEGRAQGGDDVTVSGKTHHPIPSNLGRLARTVSAL